MSPSIVRRATEVDLSALGRMGGALARLHHAWDPPRFMLPDEIERGYRWWLGRELTNPDAVVLVGEVDASVVGYCYGRLEERDWNALLDAHGALHDLWVDDSARKHGLGRRLVEAMIEALTAQGAPRIVLTTSTKNEVAQRLFASLGWRPTMVEMTRESAQNTSPLLSHLGRST
jgi:ribosomal protein S18 acetylase RimI-like enzyme